MVSYRFTAGGREMTGQAAAPNGIWKKLAEGQSLPVRYVSDRPRLNHPSAWEAHIVPVWLGLAVPLMLLVPASVMVFQVRKQWDLLSEGRPAPGTITGLRRTDKGTFVRYQFRVPDGSVIQGWSNGGRHAPGVGSQITVLYDPDHPRRYASYPMALVRLDPA
jgi:hypothetical protein